MIPLIITLLSGVSLEMIFILLALAIPTFYFWQWFLKKYIKNSRTRTIAVWVTTFLATPLLYIGLVMLFLFSISYYPTHDFDQAKWSANKAKRYEYSDHLIREHLLIGKTPVEVQQLLGDEGNKAESELWTYNLGSRPGLMNIDPDVLYITFHNGKVIAVGQAES